MLTVDPVTGHLDELTHIGRATLNRIVRHHNRMARALEKIEKCASAKDARALAAKALAPRRKEVAKYKARKAKGME
jgi:hypothetical protein